LCLIAFWNLVGVQPVSPFALPFSHLPFSSFQPH
jgi:hypothetical protein